MVPGYQRLAGSQNNGSRSYHPNSWSSRMTWAYPSWVAPRRSSRSPDFLGLDAGPKNWVPPMRLVKGKKTQKPCVVSHHYSQILVPHEVTFYKLAKLVLFTRLYPPTPALAKAGAAPGTTAGVELVFLSNSHPKATSMASYGRPSPPFARP